MPQQMRGVGIEVVESILKIINLIPRDIGEGGSSGMLVDDSFVLTGRVAWLSDGEPA